MYGPLLRRSSHRTGRLSSLIHSSAVQNQKSKHKGSSRTRLATNLKPASPSGRYEVAPQAEQFTRDTAPHRDPQLLDKHRKRGPLPSTTSRKQKQDAKFDDSRFIRSSSLSPPPQQTASKDDRMKTYKSILSSIEESPSEFYHPTSPVSLSPFASSSAHHEGDDNAAAAAFSSTPLQHPTTFASPPLLPGFIPSLKTMLGPNARPTPIQSLSIKWLIDQPHIALTPSSSQQEWRQFLLASETGSGKSLAYLLPLLQSLKLSEQSPDAHDSQKGHDNTRNKRALNPRAIILAPTHELSRQLSTFAKVLTHDVRLRVMCASQANTPSTTKSSVTAKKLAEQLDAVADGESGAFDVKTKGKFPVDILIGTPVKIMELLRGRGWDRREGELEVDADGKLPRLRRGRDKMPGVGKWKKEPELGLENVEWVVVDEADVLFDPDFQEVTRTLLADISTARGAPIQADTTNTPLSSFTPLATPSPSATSTETTTPINYPFNLVLTSATIPKNLATYLDTYHPHLIRLASPHLHRLPKSLQTEYVNWTGGNKLADIERQIRKIWSSDAMVSAIASDPAEEASVGPELSKILIFCNKSARVPELAGYLEGKGIKCVALTSTSEERKRGTNRHLEGFLRPVKVNDSASAEEIKKGEVKKRDPAVTPHVMITTSLLSRGLDFVPELEHVFIVDEPRNMVDFLHRAGRSGRAGRKGKVVVFVKMKGRGTTRSKEVRTRVKELMKR